MQTKFIILIALVFLITAGFCVLIWQQTIRFEKKALAAKQQQKEHKRELIEQMRAERRAENEAIQASQILSEGDSIQEKEA